MRLHLPRPQSGQRVPVPTQCCKQELRHHRNLHPDPAQRRNCYAHPCRQRWQCAASHLPHRNWIDHLHRRLSDPRQLRQRRGRLDRERPSHSCQRLQQAHHHPEHNHQPGRLRRVEQLRPMACCRSELHRHRNLHARASRMCARHTVHGPRGRSPLKWSSGKRRIVIPKYTTFLNFLLRFLRFICYKQFTESRCVAKPVVFVATLVLVRHLTLREQLKVLNRPGHGTSFGKH